IIYDIIKPALDFLVELNPYLWQEGQTYPANPAMLDEMFTDGLTLMTKSYTPLFVAQGILAGEFPETTQTFVFDNGNIGNTHYMAIPFNAPNKEGALRLINHIISPEIQITKYDAGNWGDFPVFDVSRLNDEQLALLDAVDNGGGILSAAELQDYRLPEVQAAKIPIIDQLWIEFVLMR
ncbi:MAG: extracellular solute-binding protein, partial [Defluviitaleaceae bacterium]|nr:extracellular solute-binding protein [Defluviitaleaceae bacterium]